MHIPFSGTASAWKAAGLALCLSSLGMPAISQAGPDGRAPPQQIDLNAILMALMQDSQAVEVAKTCNWSEPMYRLAAESMIAIREADLRGHVPADKQSIIDTTLANGKTAVAGFACTTPDGKPADQRGRVELFVMDQYWRMIAHVDVLGSYRWNQPFRFTAEERTALDKEIKHIQDFKGYEYWSVGNPLETFTDQTVALACKERPPADKPCAPVPPELEGGAVTVRTYLLTTESFGKAVAAEKIAERAAFLAAVGDITQYSSIGDAGCKPNAVVLKTGAAQVRSQTSEDSFGGMISEVSFMEKFLLGDPERAGWVLLFRSYSSDYGGDKYYVLAENGGEWDEESARTGAGQATLPDDMLAQIRSRGAPPDVEAAFIEDAKETYSQTYFTNFMSMGLMKSINGDGSLKLTQCSAD